MASKAEALAWVRLTEPRVGERIGQVQAGLPFLEFEVADLRRRVSAVPLDVVPLVFPDLG